MPDASGFLHLSDAPAVISVACSLCPRHGRYDRARAIARHGDMLLPDFLARVSADCPQREHAVNGRNCAARYSDGILQSPPSPR